MPPTIVNTIVKAIHIGDKPRGNASETTCVSVESLWCVRRTEDKKPSVFSATVSRVFYKQLDDTA